MSETFCTFKNFQSIKVFFLWKMVKMTTNKENQLGMEKNWPSFAFYYKKMFWLSKEMTPRLGGLVHPIYFHDFSWKKIANKFRRKRFSNKFRKTWAKAPNGKHKLTVYHKLWFTTLLWGGRCILTDTDMGSWWKIFYWGYIFPSIYHQSNFSKSRQLL